MLEIKIYKGKMSAVRVIFKEKMNIKETFK